MDEKAIWYTKPIKPIKQANLSNHHRSSLTIRFPVLGMGYHSHEPSPTSVQNPENPWVSQRLEFGAKTDTSSSRPNICKLFSQPFTKRRHTNHTNQSPSASSLRSIRQAFTYQPFTTHQAFPIHIPSVYNHFPFISHPYANHFPRDCEHTTAHAARCYWRISSRPPFCWQLGRTMEGQWYHWGN